MMDPLPADVVQIYYNYGIKQSIPYNSDFNTFMFNVKREFSISESDGEPFLIDQGNVRITESNWPSECRKNLILRCTNVGMYDTCTWVVKLIKFLTEWKLFKKVCRRLQRTLLGIR